MDIFTALAEPRRREILEQLLSGPCTVNGLVESLSMSQPMASKHLKVLREAGIVKVRPEGQRRWFSLRREPFEALQDWLARYRAYWTEELDSLERFLDENPD